MTSWEFPAQDPVDLQIRVHSGGVRVQAVPTQTATVTLEGSQRLLAATRVEFDRGALSVVEPDRLGLGGFGSLNVTVEVPERSSCLVHSASADVSCTGELSALDAHTASGELSAERVSGLAQVVTASGDVQVGAAAEARVETASGDVRIDQADGAVTVRTASGDVWIGQTSGRRAEVKSASGDISVAVAPGIGVYLDLSSLSGTVSSELEPAEESGGAEMTVQCRTISGDVQVLRAAQPAAR
jgi:Putative adhesin